MSHRVPPRRPPPPPILPASRFRRPRAHGSHEKEKLTVAESNEDLFNTPEATSGGGDAGTSDHREADAERRLAELDQSREIEKEEGTLHSSETREHGDREEKQERYQFFAWQKPGSKSGGEGQKEGKAPFQKPGTKSGALKGAAPNTALGTAQGTASGQAAGPARVQSMAQLQNKLVGESATNERPPDAFALLKDARESGLLFVEDGLAGQPEKEDPEHLAAVAECAILCAEVRGILRIGPGHNDQAEPVIVVVTTTGFSEASFAQVPQQVHRFPTLIAIPFELLPLRRER